MDNPPPRLEAVPSAAKLTVLIAAPTLDTGASDSGAIELVRILAAGGHRAIVVSDGGRREADIAANGGEFIRARMASKNPAVMLRNVGLLARIARERRCDAIHALGRAPAWSAYAAARIARVAFVTSWYKGFREQNSLKRLYNSVMARGDRVVAASSRIAELINDRYGTPWNRISVIPASIDFTRFDPAALSADRLAVLRAQWGVGPETKVILVAGRLRRRKGHDVVVRAVQRLKAMGLKDFVCVFTADDSGNPRYSGELWDQVLATGTADAIRMTGYIEDRPAAYAAASVVVSAAIQEEGLQRALVEAQAMVRPVIVSDLGASPEIVRTQPTVTADRATGLRFRTGDDGALAAALLHLFSMPENARRAMGARGREWALANFNARVATDAGLRVYSEIAETRSAPRASA